MSGPSVYYHQLSFNVLTLSTLFFLLLFLYFGPDVLRSRQRNYSLSPSQPEFLKNFLNPGCTSRQLDNYKSVDIGDVYRHPSVVQYVKLSRDDSPVNLTFMDYMAMMSAYKFLQPERFIIHTYTDVRGEYWNLVQKWTKTSVKVNKVKRFNHIGNNRNEMVIEHQADFLKLCGLLEFGGLVSDFDVIVVNGTRLKHMQRISECVLSQEGNHLNIGFESCVRNSSFIQEWLNTYYKDYRTGWLHNSAFKPTWILKENRWVCHNVYIVPDIATNPYHSQYEMWLKKDGVKWQDKVAAHYFNRKMKNFDKTVLNGDHSFGEMLRFVEASHRT